MVQCSVHCNVKKCISIRFTELQNDRNAKEFNLHFYKMHNTEKNKYEKAFLLGVENPTYILIRCMTWKNDNIAKFLSGVENYKNVRG